MDAVIERTVQGDDEAAADGSRFIKRVANTSLPLLYGLADSLSLCCTDLPRKIWELILPGMEGILRLILQVLLDVNGGLFR